MAQNQQAIIIKRINKAEGGHHGGAWKVAYADFVTAMMAFFLLLWLLNSVPQETLEGISNHFTPTIATKTTGGSNQILSGKAITETAAVTQDLPPPKAGTGGQEASKPEDTRDREDEQFRQAEENLKQAVESLPQLRQLKDSLLIDNTPEGLRIQLLDREGFALFPSGSAEPYLHTKRLLEQVSKVVLSMPQKLSIAGHTDAVPFKGDQGRTNWELSADRANAARRTMMEFAVPVERVRQVVGRADVEPLVVEDPKHPRNRRLAIVLLRGTGSGMPAPPRDAPRRLQETLPGLDKIRERQLQEGTAQPGGAPPAKPK
jgi:chemotaxis protein MotB